MEVLDSLFDFIFANLPLLFIVLGGLFSVFKRRNEEQQKQSQKKQVPQRPNPVLDWPGAELEPETERNWEPIKSEPEIHVEMTEQQPNPYTKKLRDLENRDRTEITQPISGAPAHTKVNKTKKKKVKQSLAIEKSSVVQGMVWSQILDSPRSKKPYSPHKIYTPKR